VARVTPNVVAVVRPVQIQNCFPKNARRNNTTVAVAETTVLLVKSLCNIVKTRRSWKNWLSLGSSQEQTVETDFLAHALEKAEKAEHCMFTALK